ncbi:MAG: LPS assembly protein LptD [Candidatus Mariimomonas ferrooxydans]
MLHYTVSTLSSVSICVLLLLSCIILSASGAFSEKLIDITADNLESIAETNTYIAKGSVKVIYGDSTLNADEVNLNNTTADIIAIGNVTYEDTEVIIKADKIELNLDTKIGTIYNSDIFYKKHNYHIQGGDLKKLGEKTYSMDRADATTCDATPPEWHFKGKDIKIKLHENIKARNATFYIKNIPVLYSPYFRAPLAKDRQTGLLMPILGYSNTKGFTFKQGFFWAIKSNMDATFYADYFSNKGIGKGIDYRYVTTPRTNGELWIYHLRDNDLLRDFTELKSFHNYELPYNMSGYLKIHLVNEFDYYNLLKSTSSKRIGLSTWESDPFGFLSEERLQKYLESNLHISRPFTGGRTYLLGQYRQSLEDSSGSIPQSLPELGFIINTRDIGMTFFNLAVTGKNFWRNNGQYGHRLDIYPSFYLSFGRAVNFTQKIGLRETLYYLKDPSGDVNRGIFDLRSSLTTRFFKRYPSFIHLIEPAIEYTYVPAVDQSSMPSFDSVDSLPKTSRLTYTFTNRVTGPILGGTEARLRLSQSYNLLNVEKSYSPVQIETAFSNRHLNFSVNALFDVYDKNISETIAAVNLIWHKGFVGIGKNFRRSTSLDQFTFEAGINRPFDMLNLSIPLNLYGKLWYDLKGNGIQELKLHSRYTSQCWGLIISYTQKHNENQIMFGIEFKGLGTLRI